MLRLHRKIAAKQIQKRTVAARKIIAVMIKKMEKLRVTTIAALSA
ncbi:hypothetical protein PGH12_13475 [Chryseobacterium wangxinyae]|nr:hypothetical protein [Chryseobacterium sp. CY350]MCY0975918.1 hypothetical protein [Chryseobacterium sp. CY350]WBZ94476.1 hypothetical protein PGH12_13475 [Chryseobacterium sp. CY350]